MEGNIYIKGEIGEEVHLVDIISQVEQQKEATSFNVFINSVGGIVDVGFDMYYYLKSLNVPIKTIGQEMVASIATVIFMAGNERELDLGTEFMIHMPSGGIQGTSKEIDEYNTMLKKYDKKIIDFYKEATNLSEEAIRPLLDYETWLSPNLAQDLRFTTKKADNVPVLAKATFNIKTEKMNNLSNEDKSWIEKQFGKILNIGKKADVKNIVLQDANGVEIDFVDVEEGAMPEIGVSTATVDGAPADGSFIMPDGQTFVFADGVLTEVIEAVEEEADASAERIAELEQQIAEMQANVDAKATEVEEKDAIIAQMKADTKALKSKITSKFEEVEPKVVKKDEAIESPYKTMVNKIKKRK